MVVRGVTVDGVPVAPTPPPLSSAPAVAPAAPPDPGNADLALLRLPLARPLEPGGAATVRLGFATTVPAEPQDGAGLFRFAPDAGSWVLGHWFPILAGYDPDSGRRPTPPAAWGDPTFADAALFDVTLAAPADLVLVTTGSEVAGEADGQRQVRRFVGGPARDFAVVADPRLASVGAEVGGTTVTSYHRPQDAAGGELILGWAARSLAVFAELFGPYPYAELDLVAVPGVVGHEFPQLVFLGADYYPDPAAAGSRPGAVEFLVAHEVAHQWWYGLVGSNPHRHAFLDEGLAEYAPCSPSSAGTGRRRRGAQLDAGLVLPYAAMLLTEGDRVVDRPTADFPDAAAYHATAYAKAGLGFAALRREVGDVAFFAGLRRYAETERFRVAAPADLRSAFEAAAGRDLGPFWRAWFEGTGGRVEVVVDPAPPPRPGRRRSRRRRPSQRRSLEPPRHGGGRGADRPGVPATADGSARRGPGPTPPYPRLPTRSGPRVTRGPRSTSPAIRANARGDGTLPRTVARLPAPPRSGSRPCRSPRSRSRTRPRSGR
jgi:hypothetical protein